MGDGAQARDVAVVEDFYARRGRRALVQLLPAGAHAALDAELAGRGWEVDSPTDVLVADVGAVLAAVAPSPARGAAAAPAGGAAAAPEVALTGDPGPAWIAAWGAAEGRADADAHAAMLGRIEPATAFALADGGAGAGFSVCERGWAGLYSIATASWARRRGVARAVIAALVGWAAGQGARRAYLLVETDNDPALALYMSLGFRRSHGYHYRMAPAR
jgi:ribosomal protein S18 acetylase RimI-like enzyme